MSKVKVSQWVTEWVSQLVTRSPIELLWTAKNDNEWGNVSYGGHNSYIIIAISSSPPSSSSPWGLSLVEWANMVMVGMIGGTREAAAGTTSGTIASHAIPSWCQDQSLTIILVTNIYLDIRLYRFRWYKYVHLEWDHCESCNFMMLMLVILMIKW